jgi:Bax protein
MVAEVTTCVTDWRPLVARYAEWSRKTLGGRLALLAAVFGAFLLPAAWFAADPLPRSSWQELGLVSETPALRRVYQSDVQDLEALFGSYSYDLERLRDGAATTVPRLSVAALPRDLAELADIEARKKIFLQTLLPLVLQANQEVRQARAKVIAALDARAAGRLGATDALWLETVAEWYGAEVDDAADLLSRIDVVPPSLVLAQAAQESGWGTSRFAQRANALFGQRAWGDNARGLKPAAANRKDFRVRAFPDLMSGVRSYLHNLNSHRAYTGLRARRAQARALGAPLQSLSLVEGLSAYSEEGEDYVRALSLLIESNRLQAFDRLRLRARSQES